jgi:hypothetical protein
LNEYTELYIFSEPKTKENKDMVYVPATIRRPGADTKVGGSPATVIGQPAAAAAAQKESEEPPPATLCCLLGRQTGVEKLKPVVAAVSSLKGSTAMSSLAR